MAGPYMQKLLGLDNDANWEQHLRDSYDKVAKQHRKSFISWGKTRFRKGSKRETGVGAGGQVGAAIPTVAGGLALGGVAVPASAVGVGVGVGAAAITLYALPVLAVLAGTVWWGYNKKKHNEVNQAIWEWWHGNTQEGEWKNPDALLSEEQAKEWLGWFGDEGIYNMNYLADKLNEAKGAYDQKFKAIEASARGLGKRILAALKLEGPQRNLAIQPLRGEQETLASKYLDLVKELEYIRYRLERTLMYYQMLDLTIRSLAFHMKDKLAVVPAAYRKAFDQQKVSYCDLGNVITEFPVL